MEIKTMHHHTSAIDRATEARSPDTLTHTPSKKIRSVSQVSQSAALRVVPCILLDVMSY